MKQSFNGYHVLRERLRRKDSLVGQQPSGAGTRDWLTLTPPAASLRTSGRSFLFFFNRLVTPTSLRSSRETSRRLAGIARSLFTALALVKNGYKLGVVSSYSLSVPLRRPDRREKCWLAGKEQSRSVFYGKRESFLWCPLCYCCGVIIFILHSCPASPIFSRVTLGISLTHYNFNCFALLETQTNPTNQPLPPSPGLSSPAKITS